MSERASREPGFSLASVLLFEMRYFYRRFGIIILLAFLCGQLCAQANPRFRSDDPLQIDPDRNPIPKPEKIRLSQIYDLIENDKDCIHSGLTGKECPAFSCMSVVDTSPLD
jgi:hypothetical protein